jgi:hypothetical protein
VVIYKPQQTRPHSFDRCLRIHCLQVPHGDRYMLAMSERCLVGFTRLEFAYDVMNLTLGTKHRILLSPIKNEADRISIRLVEINCLYAYLLWFARTVSRDLYRAAAFACSTPFWTALSITEIVSGNVAVTSCFDPESSALRNFLIYVLTLVRLLRLIARRFSLCRTLFSADL